MASVIKRFGASLVVALGLANLAAALANLPVLGWFAARRRDALAGGGVLVLGVLARPWWWLVPLMLPLQIVAASVRGWLNQRTIFDDAHAVVINVDAESHVPALLFVPNQPTNAAIVFIHGAGNSKTRYSQRAILSLRATGLAVLAVDLDGHGENQRLFDLPSVCDGVGACVAYLRQNYAHVGVYGVSLGGAVAARAVADGLHVDALAVIESPANLDPVARPYWWSETWALVRPAFWRSDDGITPLQLARQWAAQPIRTNRSLKTIFDELDVCAAIQHISVPTLLLYSTDDWIAQFAPVLQCLPASSNTVMQLYSGMAHLGVTMESAPLTAAATWLKTQLQR